MPKKMDLTGKKINRLTVIRFSHLRGAKRIWLCKCDCGNESLVETGSLSRSKVFSCGCFRSEQTSQMLIKRNTTHGKSESRIYTIWHDMIRRCTDPRVKSFKRYGAKGVTVSDEWFVFEKFYEDMGDPPGDLTLDRIDGSKGYSKENCRWATLIQQNNNRSNNRILNINNEKITMADAARKYGVDYFVLRSRLNRGWSDADAVSK